MSSRTGRTSSADHLPTKHRLLSHTTSGPALASARFSATLVGQPLIPSRILVDVNTLHGSVNSLDTPCGLLLHLLTFERRAAVPVSPRHTVLT